MKPKRRRKTPESSIAAVIRKYAAGYAADGQKDFAAGMMQAADIADKVTADGGAARPEIEGARRAPLDLTFAPPNGSGLSLEERIARIENILFVGSQRVPAPLPKAPSLLEGVARAMAKPAPPAPPVRTKRDDVGRQPAKTLSPRPLGRCEWSCLRVLSVRGPLSRTELAIRAGYAVDSGGYAVALATLRAHGLLSDDRDGVCKVTSAGLGRALSGDGAPEARAVGNVIEYWCGRVGACASAILQTLVTAYPEPLERGELARRAGYSAESGGFAVALAKLRRLELVDGLRASAALMAAASTPPAPPSAHAQA